MKPNPMLLPLGWLYGTGMRVRNLLYDMGVFPSARIGIPVISVGNLTAGGTGKTPLVEHIVRLLLDRTKRVAVVSRGYGRLDSTPYSVGANEPDRGTAELLGDELLQIALKFPSATIVADTDRVRGAAIAKDKYGANVVVLDDAFQHRRIARDLDIVAIDVTKLLLSDQILPAGWLREPAGGVRRAHLIAYTRVGEGMLQEFVGLMKSHPGLNVRFSPADELRELNGGKSISVNSLRGLKVVSFCGIGNPDSFNRGLQALGMEIVRQYVYSDHHRFTAGDVDGLNTDAKSSDCVLITTEKDAARLDKELRARFDANAYVLGIRADIIEGNDLLQQKLDSLFTKTS